MIQDRDCGDENNVRDILRHRYTAGERDIVVSQRLFDEYAAEVTLIYRICDDAAPERSEGRPLLYKAAVVRTATMRPRPDLSRD